VCNVSMVERVAEVMDARDATELRSPSIARRYLV